MKVNLCDVPEGKSFRFYPGGEIRFVAFSYPERVFWGIHHSDDAMAVGDHPGLFVSSPNTIVIVDDGSKEEGAA